MENETKTNFSLESLFDLLLQGPANRLTLHKSFPQLSRPTLIRNLNKLISIGKIEKVGNGRSVKYQLTKYNPLLVTAKPRVLNKEVHFNANVLDHLHDLITPQELSFNYRSLSSAINALGSVITNKELERFTIDLSWKSSAIEGNSYTLPETATLLTTHTPAAKKTNYETQMILNHAKAFNYIWENPVKPNRLNLSYILKIHSILTNNLNVKAGIRHSPVGISGSIYLPSSNSQTLTISLEKTIEIINNTTSPIEQALIAVAMISYIQPFVDGNKRTSRLIGNAILIGQDLIPISYRTTEEVAYRDALLLFYEQNSLVAFKNLLLEQLHFSHNHYFRIN